MNNNSLFLMDKSIPKSIALAFVFLVGVLSIIASNGNGDDEPGTLQLDSVSFSATEGLNPTVTVVVTRTGGDDGAVSVDYGTVNDTAIAPGDYTATSGTLNWDDGDSSNKSFTVDIVNDAAVELAESFDVTLSNVVTAKLGSKSTGTVTLIDNDSVPVSGNVLAPNGTVAFKQPGLLKQLFVTLFGNTAIAAISDLVSPVMGVTIGVYQVDANGDLVSATPITSATTDSFGAYALAAPLDAPDAKYIVRAQGSSETMDSRITSEQIDVTPSTDATSRMVAAITSDLTKISVTEIIEMQMDMDEIVTDIIPVGLNATQLSTSLYNEANNQIGTYNKFNSKSANGQICGNVQTDASAVLGDVLIIVRDYFDYRTRAATYTDASGNYCVNVPVAGETDPDTGGTFSGEYIVGAINSNDDTADPDRSASEWYSAGGMGYNQYAADKISVLNTTAVTGINFVLSPGARITGHITATGIGTSLEGIVVSLRDYDSRKLVASARTDENGLYQVNVIAGKYLAIARNRTKQPYATEVYDGATGADRRNLGTPVIVTAGEERSLDFVLEVGGELDGTITDGATSNPVVGERVFINVANDATAAVVSSNRQGYYHVWLKAPGDYDVISYGQRSLGVNITAGATVDFTGSVSKIEGIVEDTASSGVSFVKMWLYDAAGNFIARDNSRTDGSFTVYTDQTGDHLLLAKVDLADDAGSIIYQNDTRLLSGDLINIAAVGDTNNIGAVTLPDGGVLTGHVYSESSGSSTLTPLANFRVQVRDDNLPTAGSGTGLVDRFVQVRTQGDGSYTVTLPPGIFDRVKMRDATGTGNCNNIAITAGSTTVLNFYDGDNSCEINP